MPTLKISKFSCFDKAAIELAQMTLLIGPQASGKSVISKLFYYFNDFIQQFWHYAEEGNSLAELYANMADEFRVWFPSQAWGSRPFRIRYDAGLAYIVVTRRRSTTSGPADRVSVKFSDFLEAQYESVLKEYAAAKNAAPDETSDHLTGDQDFDLLYRLRLNYRRSMQRELGSEFVASQTFVPAGRSFFTTVGKAVAVFDQGNVLDPVTRRFGRLFANLRDRGGRLSLVSRPGPPEIAIQRDILMHELFGGVLRFGRETEFVEAADGRKIPFSILSSGQQELLPLWLALGSLSTSTPTPRARLDTSIVYIEEPEAHLFPTAQSQLFEYLASLVANPRLQRRMLITTHSPYLLSMANNLIVASEAYAMNKRRREAIEEIVPKVSILSPGAISAYAIDNKSVRSLMTSDGLIDGDYLDSISDEISSDFLKLLELSGFTD